MMCTADGSEMYTQSMDSFSRLKKLTSNIIEFMNLKERFSKEIDDSKLFQLRDILPQIPQLSSLGIDKCTGASVAQ